MPDYVSTYIQQALQHPATLQPPDPAQCNGHMEVLESLYLERTSPEGVRRAWETIKRLRPELAPLADPKRQRLLNFRELKDRQAPAYALPEADGDNDAPAYAVYLNGLNMLYGDRGTGKTHIALDFAARLALANPDKHVIYTAGEGIAGLYGRHRAWETHHRETINNLLLWESALRAMNGADVAAFVSDIEQNGYKPIMVIIDTLARAALGLNENDTRDMVLFMDAYEQLSTRLACGLLFIHHTNRVGLIRGSSVFDGALDSMLKVEASEGRITVYNRYDKGGKNKHREEAPDLQFTILPVTVDELYDPANPGAEKQAIVVPAGQRTDDPTKELNDKQRAVLEALAGIETGLSAQLLADSLDISRKNAHKHLTRLMGANYIAQDTSTGLYILTVAGKAALSA